MSWLWVPDVFFYTYLGMEVCLYVVLSALMLVLDWAGVWSALLKLLLLVGHVPAWGTAWLDVL